MPRLALPNPDDDRRQTPRFRPGMILSASIGRHEAFVADLSVAGARVYHFNAVRRGEEVRFTIRYGAHIFSSVARVLASAVDALANGPSGALTYKSRLQFVGANPAEQSALAALIADLQPRGYSD